MTLALMIHTVTASAPSLQRNDSPLYYVMQRGEHVAHRCNRNISPVESKMMFRSLRYKKHAWTVRHCSS